MAITDRWNAALLRNTEDCRRRFGALDAQTLNWKPAPDRWSVAQNLHHLIVINETYYPILDALARGSWRTPIPAHIPGLASLTGKMLLNAMQPDRRRRMKTVPMWEPSHSTIAADIVKQFETHQRVLAEKVARAAERAMPGTIIHSPASLLIVYPLATALDLLDAHERRHFEQAQEVLALRGSPGGA